MRCQHKGIVSGQLLKPDGTVLTLHRCDCPSVDADHCHERWPAGASLVVLVTDGKQQVQQVACCRGCPHFTAGAAPVKKAGQAPPTLLTRAGRYLTSTAKWLAAGSPVRTDEQVDDIALICARCEFLKDGICTHKLCGCNVRKSQEEAATLVGIMFGGGMVNKIRRATEHCPVGKW